MKVRVPVLGTIGKSVRIDTTGGAKLGSTLFNADGSVATAADLRTYILGEQIAGSSSIYHNTLRNLQVGNDHPQYPLRQASEVISGTWNFTGVPSIGGVTLPEYIEDRVGGMLTDSSSIDFTYNDGAGTITAAIIDEYVQDLVGAMATDSSSIDFTYNDGAGTFTAAIIDEYVEDLMATTLQDSTTIAFDYYDPSNKITAHLTAELGDLLDVDLRVLPAYGDVLTFNGFVWVAGTGGAAGVVDSVVAGTGITVNAADTANPIVAVDQAFSPTWSGTHTFSNPILAPAGAVGAPAYSFSADPDTGIYNTANAMLFAAGGVKRAEILGSANVANFYGGTGDHAYLGFYADAAAQTTRTAYIGFGSAGAERFYITNEYTASPDISLRIGGTDCLAISTAAITASAVYLGVVGSVSGPSYSFTTDPDTGVYRAAANQLGFATGGGLRLTIADATAAFATNVTINVAANANSTLTIGETSTLRGDGADAKILLYSEQSGAISSVTLQHTGTNLQISSSASVGIQFLGGNVAYFYDASNTKYVAINNDGTKATFNLSGLSNYVLASGPILTASGAVSAPGVAFNSDPDTGIYSVAANQLGIASGGAIGLTVAGQVTIIGNGSSAMSLQLNGAAATTRDLVWMTGGTNRWVLRTTSAAEAGANAGSDFQILRRADDGTLIQNALVITRSTGAWAFGDATTNPTYNFQGSGLLQTGGSFYTAGSIELGHSSDTTLSRVSAGVVAIEGVNILTTGTGVAATRTITAGAGLTGGGDLSANRTIDVGAGTGITVNANDVAINFGVTATWTAAHTFRRTALAVTSTDGAILENNTAATSGVPVQYSPRLRLSGTKWSGAASQVSDWKVENRPVNGSATDVGYLYFASQVASGGFNDVARLAAYNTGGGFEILNGDFRCPVGAMAYTFAGATTSGMYYNSALILAQGGNDYLSMASSAITASYPIRTAGGTAGAPSHSFSGDTNTGMYSDAADNVKFSANGGHVLTASASEIFSPYTFRSSVGFKVDATTVSSLPSAASSTGMVKYITDSTTAAHNAAVSGGGANKVMVYSDGTNWRVL